MDDSECKAQHGSIHNSCTLSTNPAPSSCMLDFGTSQIPLSSPDGGGLISNADAETSFVECVDNITVNVTPCGCGLQKKRKNVLYSSNWWVDNSSSDSDELSYVHSIIN